MSEDEHIGEVHRWLRYAHEDLVLAEALVGQPGVAARHICWLAQQSVEKALKAALIFLRIDFPRRHDLDVLRDLLPADWSVKRSTPDLADLTEWAVEARYPGEWPEAVESDAQAAARQARIVWTAVGADLAQHGFA